MRQECDPPEMEMVDVVLDPLEPAPKIKRFAVSICYAESEKDRPALKYKARCFTIAGDNEQQIFGFVFQECHKSPHLMMTSSSSQLIDISVKEIIDEEPPVVDGEPTLVHVSYVANDEEYEKFKPVWKYEKEERDRQERLNSRSWY